MCFSKQIFFALLLLILPTLAFAAHPAQILLAEGRVDDAISALQGQLHSKPDDAQSYNLLCRAYFALGSWDSGIQNCEKAVALEPNSSQYHMWLGRIYGEKADRVSFWSAAGMAKKVRSEFESAVQLDPNNVEARTDLAEFYLEAPGIVGGGKDKATAQAQSIARQDPAKANWVLGRIAEKKKDYATAEQDYRSAIEASHGSAESWLNLALFYRNRQRLDEMEDAIRHATSVQSGHSEVLVDSAETLNRTGRNIPSAIELLKRYLASKSTVEQAPAFKAHYLLGTLLEKQGDKQAAKQEYQAALSMARNFSLAQDALNRVNR